MGLVITEIAAAADVVRVIYSNTAELLLLPPFTFKQYGQTQTANTANNFYILGGRVQYGSAQRTKTVKLGLGITRINGSPFSGDFDDLGDTIAELLAAATNANQPAVHGKFIFVRTLADLPTPVGGVINLLAGYTYYFTQDIDLLGSRLVCAKDTCILSPSSENATISSTGLSASTALLTATDTLPIRHITFTHDLVLDINAAGNDGAFDWTGVNFLDCANVGTIQNIGNFIFTKGALLNSKGLIFDGTAATISFDNSFFLGQASGTIIQIAATANITRRFRICYSSLVAFAAAVGIDVNAAATVPVESYILDTVNFSGGATYLQGVTETSNKALFVNCKPITNTAVNGQLFTNTNVTPTTIADTVNFFKVLGATTGTSLNSKYTATNNRLTNNATISRRFLVQANVSFNAGNNNQIEFAFYNSVTAAIIPESITPSTANSAGRAESVSFFAVVEHMENDYLEIWVRNTTATTNVTATHINFIVTQIN